MSSTLVTNPAYQPSDEYIQAVTRAQQAATQRERVWWPMMLPVAMAQLELLRGLMETPT